MHSYLGPNQSYQGENCLTWHRYLTIFPLSDMDPCFIPISLRMNFFLTSVNYHYDSSIYNIATKAVPVSKDSILKAGKKQTFV